MLIVDDSSVARMVLKKINAWHPQSAFVITGEASNGVEALAEIEKNHYDLVITDIEMPDMNGLELLQIISDKYPDLKVILVSTYRDFDLVRTGLIHGAFDYLVKPVTTGAMFKTFERLQRKCTLSQPQPLRMDTLEGYIEYIHELMQLEEKLPTDVIHGYRESIMKKFSIPGNERSVISMGIKALLAKTFEKHPSIGVDELAMTIMGHMSVKNCMKDHEQSKIGNMIEFECAIEATCHVFREMLLPSYGNEFVQKVVVQVLENFNRPQSVNCIAQQLFVNRSYLSQVFKKQSGMTLSAYLTRVKMVRGSMLLVATNKSVAEISTTLGYEDKEHFSNVFRSHVGMLPRAYRKAAVLE